MLFHINWRRHPEDPEGVQISLSTELEALAIALANALLVYLRGEATHGELHMSKTLNIGGTSTASVAYTDAAGVSVPVSGAPTWTVDDATIASVTPAADGLSAAVVALKAGTATITVVAEGDPTPGVDTITLTGTVNVVDEASGGTLTFT